MKRLHVHVAVKDLASATRFYATLFGAQPTVVKGDYAKWMLDDPRVNFAISTRTGDSGVDHLGIQVDSREELATIAGQLASAGERLAEQTATSCCYAKSDKAWVKDPEGISWETFYTFGTATEYGEDLVEAAEDLPATAGPKACCAPSADKVEASACCAA
jgi:catechol 2,3-dioxygenase-like lactoylglutathione lyase family enzyme